MVFKKIKEFGNTGFGANVDHEGGRLISKDGKFNVKKEGLDFSERFHLFHTLMNMSTFLFFFYLLLVYFVVNILFTSIYILVGVEGIGGTYFDNQFLSAFFFSAQTLTTVGYGALHPINQSVGFISSFEAFIGLLGFAVSTGLLYGRFSKPKIKLLFSKHSLVSTYKEITGLMVRIANPKDSQLINVEAIMIFSEVIENEGVRNRKFYTLDLEMDKISLFATSWTIVHPITNESPLYNLTGKDFAERDVELILLIGAYDETYNQDVHVRSSFKYDEIITNAKFIPILGQNDDEQAVIHLDKLNDYEKQV